MQKVLYYIGLLFVIIGVILWFVYKDQGFHPPLIGVGAVCLLFSELIRLHQRSTSNSKKQK